MRSVGSASILPIHYRGELSRHRREHPARPLTEAAVPVALMISVLRAIGPTSQAINGRGVRVNSDRPGVGGFNAQFWHANQYLPIGNGAPTLSTSIGTFPRAETLAVIQRHRMFIGKRKHKGTTSKTPPRRTFPVTAQVNSKTEFAPHAMNKFIFAYSTIQFTFVPVRMRWPFRPFSKFVLRQRELLRNLKIELRMSTIRPHRPEIQNLSNKVFSA